MSRKRFPQPRTEPTQRQSEILASLSTEPETTTTIAQRNGIAAASLKRHLLCLHDLGLVERHQGARFGKVRWSRVVRDG